MTVYVKSGGGRQRIPEAYLDTCLVSGLVEDDLRDREKQALRKLVAAYKDKRLGLVTSRVTKDELGRMSDEKRARHETIYGLLIDVPEAEEVRTDSGMMLMGVGGGRRDDPDFATLKTILPDLEDARHLFQTIRNGVDYFVTDDERTIVSRAAQVESQFSIRVRLPSTLVAELESAKRLTRESRRRRTRPLAARPSA